MKWTPQIEIGGSVIPLAAFTGGVEVDRSSGEASLGGLSIARSAAPLNPSAWFLKPVKVSIVLPTGTVKLFEGQLRGSQVSPVQGLVTYSAASMTKGVIANSDAVFAQLETEVPWSDAIFGARSEMSRAEQFDKLLSASNYTLGDTGLMPIDTLVKFHKGLGEPLNSPGSYKAFHTDADVVAKVSPAGDIGEPFSIDFSEPKLSAPLAEDGSAGKVVLPEDVIAEPPVNFIRVKVVHRFKCLCQEAFTYYYEGGHIITDHVEQGAYWLTLEALESALAGTGMHVMAKEYENAQLYGNVGSGADPVYAGVSEEVRNALVQNFNVTVVRRYITDREFVYEREVRCNESIARYGLKEEVRETTIEDSTDFSDFTSYAISPKFAAAGYMEVRNSEHFAALKKASTATRQEAEKAVEAMVGQAQHDIKVAHSASLTGEVGSSTLITTGYTVLLDADSAQLDVGDDVAVQTSIWTVSGVVSGLVASMSPDGSARLGITLTTNVAPALAGAGESGGSGGSGGAGGGVDHSGEVPAIRLNETVPIPAPIGFDGNPLPLAVFVVS